MLSCVFNQSKGHWLLSDVLNSPISICLKLRKEFGKLGSFDNFIEEESIFFLISFFGLKHQKKFVVF